MKRILLALALFLLPSIAMAQCNGVFPANTICGNASGGNAVPKPTAPSGFIVGAGGTNGQIQYNNSGSFGGFTANQDCTITPSTGAVNCTKLQNVPIQTTSASTNDVMTYNGSTWIHSALLTLINTLCTATPNTCGSLFGTINPAWYGAKCDGVTDDTTSLNTMLAAAGGKTVLFPDGTCVITTHLTPVSSTVIKGSGRDVSVIKMTGADVIFAISNISNITISDLWLLGTDSYTSWTLTRYGAMNIATSTPQSNMFFRNLRLSGFNANYWIGGTQSVGTPNTNVEFDHIWIGTTLADVPTDPTQINNSNYGIVLYSGSGGARWENVTYSNIQIDGTYMCFGLTLFSNHYKWKIINNSLLNLGVSTSGNHCLSGLGGLNTYGILVYDVNSDGNPPNDGLIAGNYILNPNASGIYNVGDGGSFLLSHNTNHTLIANNVVVGETFSDQSLPRGGIVVSLSTDIEVCNNFLFNNAIGINIAAQNAGTVSVCSNHIESGAGGSIGLSLGAGGNGSSNADRRIVRSNSIDANSTSVLSSSSTGSRFNFVDISGNTINAQAAGTGLSFANQFVINLAGINNNTFLGSGTLASLGGLTGSMSLIGNANLSFTVAGLPAGVINGSSVFTSDGTPASSPCTGASTGSTAFRQNAAWKCF